MRKILILLICFPHLLFGQESMISYPVVVREFYNHYSYISEQQTDGLEFAKKKDGWFVRVVDRVTEKPLREELFWSAKNGRFVTLSGFDAPLEKEEARKEIDKRFGFGFYSYERTPYYGYAGWDMDMIRDFGTIPFQQLSDSTLEGLGRAYSAYASRFLWYQYGGNVDTDDTLIISLKPGQMPGSRRVDSSALFISKAVSCF
jgi:hypothetical protein